MHIEIKTIAGELSQLIRCQRRCCSPYPAARTGFRQREYHRACNATGADMDMCRCSRDVGCDDGRFHDVAIRIKHDHTRGRCHAIGGRYFISPVEGC